MKFEITQRALFRGNIIRKGATVDIESKDEFQPKSMRAVNRGETPPWEKPAPKKREAKKAEATAPGDDTAE